MSSNLKATQWVVLACSLVLVGCGDYRNKRDSITAGIGNAPQANIELHAVKAYPPHANNTKIDISEVKTKQAYERYLEPCDPDVVTCGGSDETAIGSE